MAGEDHGADEETNPNETEEGAPISVPSHTPLPPPPVVNYTRPPIARTTSRATGETPHSGPSRTGSDDSGGTANHGAGLAAGSTFVVGIIAGATVGNWIDQHYNHTSMPWATLVMTLLGAAAGFSNMLRLLSRSKRNGKK